LPTTARALGLSPKNLSRILNDRAPLLRRATIRRLMSQLEVLERAEALETERLSRLTWSDLDNTAQDGRGRWYARYATASGFAYLTGAGEGYETDAEARFAAFKMQIVASAVHAAE
jgi:hypothetical protein